MGVTMLRRVRTPLAFVFAAAVPMAAMSLPAQAAGLPQVELSTKNKVPACTTPGRLMGFLESRNPSIDPRFRTIAADYMRIGNQLKIRWDIAFFQMMLETGNLTFRGDVQANQNNFAGMGATGSRVPGESFPDVATGVKAHLQHLLMYAGEHIDDPVAERTRKVQEWGILTSWQKSISGPITYDQLAKQWAPTSRRYGREIAGLAEAFYGSPCKSPDPQPELMALAQPGGGASKATASTEKPQTDGAATQTASETDAAADSGTYISGAALAKRAVEEARKSGSFGRSSLGAESLIPASDTAPAVGEPQASDAAPTSFKIINAATTPEDDASSADAPNSADSAAIVPPAKKSSSKKVQTAALGAGTKTAMTLPAAGVKPKCKVWTASYGGNHSVIIRARGDAQDNYTVLDVNEGSEKREADAYIAAYAKGGVKVGEFANPSQALDKAFELCPDG
ncbi:MAG: glucosaminidase domain-containing protein [Proteobacteria bacterium]|nr:glucosaminidase domain-containing protein [Pseudomonadota bacterium]